MTPAEYIEAYTKDAHIKSVRPCAVPVSTLVFIRFSSGFVRVVDVPDTEEEIYTDNEAIDFSPKEIEDFLAFLRESAL